MKVKRIILNGEYEPITFDTISGEYMVKNFSDNFIYVSFDSNPNDNESIKISSNCYQVVVINESFGGLSKNKSKTIYIKGTGEVEVQQICYQ